MKMEEPKGTLESRELKGFKEKVKRMLNRFCWLKQRKEHLKKWKKDSV